MHRRGVNSGLLSSVLVLIATSLCLLSCDVPLEEDKPPNILLIIADDLGWGDVGYHGSDIRTPHLDRLAQEGLELNRFYVAPICSPTRAGLLTGRYPERYGLRNNVVRPWLDFGLDTGEVTLPDLLADAGYANRALVGKWHLGHSRKAYHPLHRGYSYFYGHLNGAIDYFELTREGERDWHENFTPSPDTGYATDLIGGKALQLLRTYSQQDAPFFLQVAFNAPHSPIQARRSYLDQYGFDPAEPTFAKGRGRGNTMRQTYAAMVTHMDDEIGSMLSLLDSLKITDNTIVLFMSDNGAELRQGGSNGALKGAKLTEWEGGVRVPALIRWPGVIEPGHKSDQVVGYVDVLPTLLSLIEFNPEDEIAWDGMDMSAALSTRQVADRTLYLGNGALLQGQHKLVEEGERVGLTRMEVTEDHLFELTSDENESTNLVSVKSEKYMDMKRAIQSYKQIVPSVPRPDDARPPDFIVPKKWKVED